MVEQLQAAAGRGAFSIWQYITTYTMDSVCGENYLFLCLCIDYFGQINQQVLVLYAKNPMTRWGKMYICIIQVYVKIGILPLPSQSYSNIIFNKFSYITFRTCSVQNKYLCIPREKSTWKDMGEAFAQQRDIKHHKKKMRANKNGSTCMPHRALLNRQTINQTLSSLQNQP